jgi:hypothetical protein
MENLLDDVRKAFDNSVTPYFALIICLWGMYELNGKL